MSAPPEAGRPTSVTVIAWVNFGLSIQMVILAVLFAVASIFGALFSGDPLADRIGGGIVGTMLSFFFLAASGVHVAAWIGLLRRRHWGFYAHIVGAIMEVCSCWGTTYTVIAIIFALQEDFRRYALPET